MRLEEPPGARDALNVEVVLLLGAKRVVSSSQTAVAQTVSCIPLQCIPGGLFRRARAVIRMTSCSAKCTHWSTSAASLAVRPRSPRLGRERAHYSMHACIHQVTPKCLRPTKQKKSPIPYRAMDAPSISLNPLVILERGDRRVRELVHVLGGVLFVTPNSNGGKIDLEACDGGCASNLCMCIR